LRTRRRDGACGRLERGLSAARDSGADFVFDHARTISTTSCADRRPRRRRHPGSSGARQPRQDLGLLATRGASRHGNRGRVEIDARHAIWPRRLDLRMTLFSISDPDMASIKLSGRRSCQRHLRPVVFRIHSPTPRRRDADGVWRARKIVLVPEGTSNMAETIDWLQGVRSAVAAACSWWC
jgi:hypothetical protein